MDTLILRNTGTTPLQVQDMGVYLNSSEEMDLILNFRNEDILESQDLETVMSGDGVVELTQSPNPAVELTYSELVDYLTSLTRYDQIDYSYISGKDLDTDVTGLELEQLTDGSDITLHNHDNRYYTKTNLQTSGEASIHWDNLTNAPQFGALTWQDPVNRTDSSYGSGTTLPVSDNDLNDARMVADDGDGKPAQYVCVATSGTWDQQWKKIADVDWGSSNSIGVTPSGNLVATNVQAALYELQSDIDGIVSGTLDINVSLDDAYDDGSSIIVDNTDVNWQLTDTKNFKITTDGGLTNAMIISAASGGDKVEINAALDVNASVFTIDGTNASSVNVTGNSLTLKTTTSGNVNISAAGSLNLDDGNLTSAIPLSESGVTALDPSFTATSIIGAINESLNLATGADTLDEVYDSSAGSGAGRTITVDSGSVKLDASSGNFAPIELTEQTAAPSADLAAGQLSYINNQLYVYDGDRSKWLSVNELHYQWSDRNSKGKYLPVGSSLDAGMGYRVPMNATVCKVSVWSSNSTSRSLELRKNGTATALKTFSLAAGVYTSTNDDIDLTANDVLQVYVSGASGPPVKDVIVSVYVRWRA